MAKDFIRIWTTQLAISVDQDEWAYKVKSDMSLVTCFHVFLRDDLETTYFLNILPPKCGSACRNEKYIEGNMLHLNKN